MKPTRLLTLRPGAGAEAVRDAVSVCRGATRPEFGHGRRTSRTAHPRTTGAAVHRLGATRTALAPHTPDRGPSARPPPSRACGRSASERCWPSRLLRRAGRLACRRGPTARPPAETPAECTHGKSLAPHRSDARGNTRISRGVPRGTGSDDPPSTLPPWARPARLDRAGAPRRWTYQYSSTWREPISRARSLRNPRSTRPAMACSIIPGWPQRYTWNFSGERWSPVSRSTTPEKSTSCK